MDFVFWSQPQRTWFEYSALQKRLTTDWTESSLAQPG
jgi:hypothetical protein